VGALLGLPLLFVAITIAATTRKAGLRYGLGAIAGIFIIYAVVAAATNHPGKERPFANAGAARAGFLEGASSSCAKEQRAVENKTLSAADIGTFCSCYANSLADVVERTELADLDRHQTPAPSLVEKIGSTIQKCLQLL